MVSVFGSVDYNIGICFFFARHPTLRSKDNDWLALNSEHQSKKHNLECH